ncbi:MAG: class I SAM-dependent methyltransferase [Fibrobacterota bacterium]
MNISYANSGVLDFYKTLPFNFYGNAVTAAIRIKASNPLACYPALTALLQPSSRVLDVGCGAGWLVNSMNYYYQTNADGIDFNPVALEQAKQVAHELKTKDSFQEADLFLYSPDPKYDIVVSMGVLHHTDNCIEAVRHLCRDCVKPGGHLFIGLYHLYGRRPFLDYFAKLRAEGMDEESLFKKYRILHPVSSDETFLRSWFRDQVLHPHETQHTLKEILPVLEDENMEFLSSSINGFIPNADRDELTKKEKEYEATGVNKLKERTYFPGFFIFLAQKRAEGAVS